MPRKKPAKPAKPFFTGDVDSSRAPAAIDDGKRHGRDKRRRDWVDRADDELIEARPFLRQTAETEPRESIALMYERSRARARKDLLSKDEFARKLAEADDDSESILGLLAREKALSENGAKGTFSPAELYVFYCNYRRTAADELLSEFQTPAGLARLRQIHDECVRLAQRLRWAVQLSECFDGFPMPDEMRVHVLRDAGAVSPKQHDGWLERVAEWLNEAAYRLQRSPGGVTQKKEKAFQLAWYEKAMRRAPENPVVLWEVGRRMFLLAFPSTRTPYAYWEDYRHAVQQRLRKPKATPPRTK